MLATGLVAGLMAGLLGVGGGIIMVPAMFYSFTLLDVEASLRMHLAVGSSLAIIVVTSMRSVRAHYKRGAVDAEILKSWGLPVIVGALLGVALAGIIGGKALTGLFALLAALVAGNLMFGEDTWRLGDQLPRGVRRWGLAGGTGLFSAMLGIGGGTFGVTIMTLYGRPIHQAVGTSAGLGLLIGLPGMAGFVVSGWGVSSLPPLSMGYVNLAAFALITPATILAAPWGARMAHAVSRVILTHIFAGFLTVMSVFMFLELAEEVRKTETSVLGGAEQMSVSSLP